MADSTISALNSLTKSTVATTDVLPIDDVSATETKKIQVDELLQPRDDVFRVVGSADTTKKVAFEVDGLTTATTRTLTVSDENGTIATDGNTITLSNKTLGTNTGVTLGSDATGDIYYRNSSGKLTRLAIGSPNYILNANASGVPEWITNPAVTNASTTAKGVVEAATTSEVNAGTATGGTGAVLVVTPDALAASAPTFSAANLTNIPGNKIAITTTDVTFSNTTTETNIVSQSIAGGVLGTSGAVRVTIFVNSLVAGQASGTDAFTIRFKYGGTTLSTQTITPVSGVTGTFVGKIEFVLAGAGSTSSQNGVHSVLLTPGSLIANGNVGRYYYGDTAQGTSSIDSTTSQTLAITGQYASANASNAFTASLIVVEKIV